MKTRCRSAVIVRLIAATVAAMPLVAGGQESPAHHGNEPLPPAEQIAKLPADGGPEFNRLIFSSSPYLLQHVRNPVDWYEWGDEAFARAKRENKPILLSVGYAACHWCHVMARESFENEPIARIMNKHFVSIKVDREERPDIDEVYMAATTALAGRGGWPMTVFMTPDGEPFFCGTYFPPESRGGRRGFREICEDIGAQWRDNKEGLVRDAASLVSRVASRKRITGGVSVPERSFVSANVERLMGSFDMKLGGMRSSRNKFPPTFAMELIMREYATQQEVSKPYLIDPVMVTLDRMADGGIYDHIGGGICRYSTDSRWFAPHFEKMLYDQARVSGVYLSAYQLTGNAKYARVARGILDYCLADLRSPAGGFYSSRDADSEGEEGTFYVWSRAQLEAVLDPEDVGVFCAYYNVTSRGNWHRGMNILHVKTTDEAFAKRRGMSTSQWRDRLERMRRKVFEVRSRRVPPGLDDKILVEWNGLFITSLARAYRILDEPRYRDAAVKAGDFILREMVRDGRLMRSYRRGIVSVPGNAADYANAVEAMITLYETTFDRKWLAGAERLNDVFIKHFSDKQGGGFFYTADDAERLIVRTKGARDSVVPSANSTAVHNFLRLAILLDRPDLAALAERTMRTFERLVSSGGLQRMQWAVLFYHHAPKEIAIIGEQSDPATKALIGQAFAEFMPNKIVASCTAADAQTEGAISLLRKKTKVRGKPAAYVCQNYVCRRPVTTPDALATELMP